MLRITQAPSGTEQRWTLCGQLTGPWVEELRACWRHRSQVPGGTRVVVNLTDVTFIDERGEKLLSEMRSEGAAFEAAGVDTQHLLKNLMAKGERSLRRCIAPLTNRCETSEKSEGSK